MLADEQCNTQSGLQRLFLSAEDRFMFCISNVKIIKCTGGVQPTYQRQ